MAGRQHRPRGHIEERSNGTYRAVVYAGIDPLTSKPRYLKKTAPTHAEAAVELTRLQNQVDEQRHPRSGITVGQVIEKWLDVAELEDTTRERYDGLIRLHIAPTFGDNGRRGGRACRRSRAPSPPSRSRPMVPSPRAIRATIC